MRGARAARWSFTLLAVAALALACARGRRERLVLGAIHLPTLALVYVAEAKGYFAARGLDVEVRRFSTGREAVAALGEGRVDAATAYDTPVVLRAPRDPLLRVLTTLHASSSATRLVARGDRGIASASDLAGKRIGIARRTSAEYFLDLLLAWDGVPRDAVRVLDVAPEAGPEALASGEVDALVAWSPVAERARRLAGPAGVVELRSEVYTEQSVLVTRDPVLAARRPALVKLVAALADAERLARARPAEAVAVLRAEFPGLGEEDLAAAWRAFRPRLGITHELAEQLADEALWFAARGEGGPVDVGALLAPDVLAEVDPEAVTFLPLPRGGR